MKWPLTAAPCLAQKTFFAIKGHFCSLLVSNIHGYLAFVRFDVCACSYPFPNTAFDLPVSGVLLCGMYARLVHRRVVRDLVSSRHSVSFLGALLCAQFSTVFWFDRFFTSYVSFKLLQKHLYIFSLPRGKGIGTRGSFTCTLVSLPCVYIVTHGSGFCKMEKWIKSTKRNCKNRRNVE